jgi:hypothetical protein
MFFVRYPITISEQRIGLIGNYDRSSRHRHSEVFGTKGWIARLQLQIWNGRGRRLWYQVVVNPRCRIPGPPGRPMSNATPSRRGRPTAARVRCSLADSRKGSTNVGVRTEWSAWTPEEKSVFRIDGCARGGRAPCRSTADAMSRRRKIAPKYETVTISRAVQIK